MPYVLGIDGGGSKTVAVLCDERGVTLGYGVAGCGNHQRTGVRSAAGEIRTACDQALTQAGIERHQVSFTEFALAGADRPKDYEILRPALAELMPGPWEVVCDTMAGLRMGSNDRTGIVLVCGSGTNALGRDAHGSVVQVGGFGSSFGDATGGYEIAREVFRCSIRSYEGRELPSSLTERVPKHFGQPSMQALFEWAIDDGLREVPLDLTKIVHEEAEKGDPLSQRILAQSGRELAVAATAVYRRLWWPGDSPVRVILIGSVLQKGRSPHLLAALRGTFEPVCPAVEWIVPALHPVYGAALLAMDHLGIPVNASVMAALETFGKGWGLE